MINKIIEVAHVLPVLENSKKFILEINPKFTALNGEDTLSNIGGKCEFLSSGKLESGLECAIRETSEETGMSLDYLEKLNFYYFGEITREISGNIFHSHMYLVYFSDKVFKLISQRKNIWVGDLNDFQKSTLKCIIDKDDFVNQTKEWLDIKK